MNEWARGDWTIGGDCLMCHVCPLCDGKGWRWTGACRELCRGCLGFGHPRPVEDHAKGPMPQVADPIRSRTR